MMLELNWGFNDADQEIAVLLGVADATVVVWEGRQQGHGWLLTMTLLVWQRCQWLG